mmetsp:Transcript_49100/g.111153  ORF Transcript_49100/g.111153 Transcript_49100/m.111153 type:complete len:201 (-) Transcript_49100:454-1056(-)
MWSADGMAQRSCCNPATVTTSAKTSGDDTATDSSSRSALRRCSSVAPGAQAASNACFATWRFPAGDHAAHTQLRAISNSSTTSSQTGRVEQGLGTSPSIHWATWAISPRLWSPSWRTCSACRAPSLAARSAAAFPSLSLRSTCAEACSRHRTVCGVSRCAASMRADRPSRLRWSIIAAARASSNSLQAWAAVTSTGWRAA